MDQWLAGKELSGSELSPTRGSRLGSPLGSCTSKGSSNWQSPVSSTGKSLSTVAESSLFDPFGSCSGLTIGSSPDRLLRRTTFGRRLLESREPSLNLEKSPLNATHPPIGTLFGPPPSPEILAVFPRMCEYEVTLHCEPSARSFYFQLAWSELVLSTGAEQELVSLEKPGKNPVWKVILRIQEQNSGVGIAVRNMLSSMNFVEESTSPMFCGGWIDTRFELKSRDLVCPCVLKDSGSLLTLTHPNGGQTWTLKH